MIGTVLRIIGAVAVGIATGAAVWMDWRLLFPLLILALLCLFIGEE